MGTFSIWHLLLVLLLAMVLFGRGKISDLMGDVAKGIKSFKKGMAEDEPPTRIGQSSAPNEAHAAKADEGVKQ